MQKKKKIAENLSAEAAGMELDHEVQMARAQLYHLANDAIRLHKLLKNVSESEGLEGWIQSKITLAADYLKSAADYVEYNQLSQGSVTGMPSVGMPESATGMSAGSVAAVTKPLKPIVRR